MENITIQIRPAKLSDIPAISNLLQVAFADYYNVLGVKIKTANETHEEIKKEIEEKNVYVATANMFMIVGTIRFHKAGDICYISRFGVLPKWQSTGTGGLLLKQAERFCEDNDLSAMALHTATKLTKQVCYYYKQGFFIHSTTTDKGYIRGLLIKEYGKNYSLKDIEKY
ncbi:MAG: GNAT family N-acetyltransferase [Eubacteriales bacterium]